ncbi:HNH endonuclease [Paraburkholderia tropica]|nr:HNH endonuclease [Paraburkholderia tropica]
MVDRYLPALDAFVLTADEHSAVTSALASPDPWEWNPGGAQSIAIASVKTKIRDYHLARHDNKCCYCRVNLHGGGHFMTDREHVLPKSVANYRPLSYTMWNLSIACKRCNMEYKKNRTDFVVALNDASLLQEGANYRFIHPNFDLYREHLSRFAQEVDETVIVKYAVVAGSAKGAYTYDYFNLRGLEVNSFDRAQGLDTREVPGEAAQAVRSLAASFGQ